MSRSMDSTDRKSVTRLSYNSFFWLSARECLRVAKLWIQTILAPVIGTLLFIIVFGLSLGSRIREIDGFEYQVFILPGLIAMAAITAAYSNNSSSIFQARNDRFIEDILAAPMRAWQMNVGLSIGGVFRALVTGGLLVAIGTPIVGASIAHPLALAVAVLAAISVFASMGVIIGIYAKTWDHHTFVANLIIQPLVFVGGVFYSVNILPAPWKQISQANPIFYMVDAVRYGYLGVSDVNFGLSIAVTLVLAALMFAWSSWIFRTGYRLKP